MKTNWTAAFGFALLSWVATPCQTLAQAEVGVGVGFGAFTGSDFSESHSGSTFGLALYFPFLGALQGGFQVDYSSYPGGGIEGDTSQRDYLAAARYVIPRGSLRLLGAVKMGFSRQLFTVTEEPATTQGFVVGPSAGIQFWRGSLALEVTGDALYHTYEEFILYTRRQHGTDEDGLRFVVRAGIVVGFGGG